MLRVDAELFHYLGARRAQAEPMQPDHLSIEADVLIPNLSHPGFNCDTFTTFVRQSLVPVFLRLAVKTFEARHGDNSYAVAELLRRRDSELQFAPAGHDDQVEFPFLLSRNVTTSQYAFATLFHVDIV